MENGAVITADIVKFTQLSAPDQQKLLDILSSFGKPYLMEFYRGDSFQVYLMDAKEALSLLLILRTAAKTIHQDAMMPLADIRASIGIGQVVAPVQTLNTASGEAFILSGRSFDNMIKSEQKLIILSEIPTLNAALKIIAYFVDYLMDQLTFKQAAVVFELLNNQTQKEAARKLNKSQATINQHLHSAAWAQIEKLLEEYEQLTSQFQ
jgi:hypothetical protein